MLLALPAAGRFGWPLQGAARLLLNALRAIPELVWAALTVLAAGLGPNAGTLALALHTAGVLGRLFAEALENAPPEPAAAIRLQGGSQVAAFCFGTLPNLWPQLLAYSLYRWEKSLFQEAQASTVIMGMLLLVLFVDLLSDVLRQRYVRA
ncbi:ABC transporter permease subunit [Pseudomonas putida]|uniref:ABC transporter permease subunit n=1 Tax=Pseudomonas putida TaxID=303 RepID=UPI0035B6A866